MLLDGARNFYWFCSTLRAFDWKMKIPFARVARRRGKWRQPTSRLWKRQQNIGRKAPCLPRCIIKYDLCNHEGSSVYVYQIIKGKIASGLRQRRSFPFVLPLLLLIFSNGVSAMLCTHCAVIGNYIQREIKNSYQEKGAVEIWIDARCAMKLAGNNSRFENLCIWLFQSSM